MTMALVSIVLSVCASDSCICLVTFILLKISIFENLGGPGMFHLLSVSELYMIFLFSVLGHF